MFGSVARAELRDNVVADYQNGVEPEHWSYLWNANGPIEDINGFVPLNPWKSKWAPNLDRALLNEPPGAGYLEIRNAGNGYLRIHPGGGEGQYKTTEPRFAILAYKVSSDGNYFIKNSELHRLEKGGTITCMVFVKNHSLQDFVVENAERKSFDGPVGYLKAGDQIYVAVGPDGSDGRDACDIRFEISDTAK